MFRKCVHKCVQYRTVPTQRVEDRLQGNLALYLIKHHVTKTHGEVMM